MKIPIRLGSAALPRVAVAVALVFVLVDEAGLGSASVSVSFGAVHLDRPDMASATKLTLRGLGRKVRSVEAPPYMA
jgi:hypothetical protein